jgi:hypothetical protein
MQIERDQPSTMPRIERHSTKDLPVGFFGSVLLIFDLLSGKIDSPLYQTRGRELLFVEFHRTNYGIYEAINAAVRGLNEFAGLFDFNITRDTFLNRIKSVSYLVDSFGILWCGWFSAAP